VGADLRAAHSLASARRYTARAMAETGVEPARAGRRRTFLEAREVPGLVIGSLRGELPALRRIVGARRGGRIGVALAALGLALAAPPRAIVPSALLTVALALLGRLLGRRRHGLSSREYLRIVGWLAAPLWLLAAPLRAVDPDAIAPGVFGAVIANLLLWRNLRGGLGGGERSRG
jgi:hypothetical protein